MYAVDCLPISEPVRTTAPTLAQEPITVAEAARQCGVVEASYHEPELAGIIAAARKQVEDETGLVCYTGEFTYKMTDWPAADWFTIPLRPITSITSIAYVDSSGDSQTWASSNYSLKTGAVKPFVHLTYGSIFPVVRGDYHGITVTFVAGYASVAAIPAEVKTAVKLAVKILWLLQMEQSQEAQREQAGYDRWIELIRRRNYP